MMLMMMKYITYQLN